MKLGKKACERAVRFFSGRLMRRTFRTPAVGERKTPQIYAEWEFLNAAQALFIFAPHQEIAGRRVLDVGCGLGGKTTYYALHGATSVVGLDDDATRIEEAGAFARSKSVDNVRFDVGSAAMLPYGDGEFDVVILQDTIEHVHDPRRVMGECRRVLRPGGMILTAFPPFGSPWGAHLFAHVPIPWAQYVFREDALVDVWKHAFLAVDSGERAALSPEKRKAVEEADTLTQLVRIAKLHIREFRDVVDSAGLRIRLWRTHAPKPLWLCARIPFLREYTVTRVVAVLEHGDV